MKENLKNYDRKLNIHCMVKKKNLKNKNKRHIPISSSVGLDIVKSEHGIMDVPELSFEPTVPTACHPCLSFIYKVQSVYRVAIG